MFNYKMSKIPGLFKKSAKALISTSQIWQHGSKFTVKDVVISIKGSYLVTVTVVAT